MAEFNTNERVLKSDLSPEECKKIEKILRNNNISYYERWKNHGGIFGLFDRGNGSRCDLYVHMDFYEKAREVID